MERGLKGGDLLIINFAFCPEVRETLHFPTCLNCLQSIIDTKNPLSMTIFSMLMPI